MLESCHLEYSVKTKLHTTSATKLTLYWKMALLWRVSVSIWHCKLLGYVLRHDAYKYRTEVQCIQLLGFSEIESYFKKTNQDKKN